MKELRESFYLLMFFIPKMREGALMYLRDCLLKNKRLDYSIIRQLSENSKISARNPEKHVVNRLDKLSSGEIRSILNGLIYWLPRMDASDLLFLKDWIIENEGVLEERIIYKLEKRMEERYSSFLQRRSKVESTYETRWW